MTLVHIPHDPDAAARRAATLDGFLIPQFGPTLSHAAALLCWAQMHDFSVNARSPDWHDLLPGDPITRFSRIPVAPHALALVFADESILLARQEGETLALLPWAYALESQDGEDIHLSPAGALERLCAGPYGPLFQAEVARVLVPRAVVGPQYAPWGSLPIAEPHLALRVASWAEQALSAWGLSDTISTVFGALPLGAGHWKAPIITIIPTHKSQALAQDIHTARTHLNLALAHKPPLPFAAMVSGFTPAIHNGRFLAFRAHPLVSLGEIHPLTSHTRLKTCADLAQDKTQILALAARAAVDPCAYGPHT